MNYIEVPLDKPVCKKHVQQGQVAILTDAIGPTSMIDFCQHADHEMFAMVADTILMLDVEKWIRDLPSHAGARADQDSIRLCPADGANITFDRYCMTLEGFLPRKEMSQYRMRKQMEYFKEMSRQGKLYVAKSEVNGRG